MRKHIPNFFTLCNLMAGSVALVMVFSDKPGTAVLLIMLAALFDFADGFIARLLHSSSETGKQLDSLSDIVSFGILPATFIYSIMQRLSIQPEGCHFSDLPFLTILMLISILIVPAFSAIRLARFNVQNGHAESFSGLPTPAHALFWTGIYYEMMINGSLYGTHVKVWFIWLLMIITATLMIAPLPMIALKFKNYRFRGNAFRYILLFSGLLILVFLQVPGLPVLILAYILLSLLQSLLT